MGSPLDAEVSADSEIEAVITPPRPRWKAPALIGAAAVAGTAAIAVVDPSDSGVPVCWSQGVFGIDCPLCGGLRCVNALARGDVLAAADHNVLLAVVLPAVAITWALWMVRSLQDRSLSMPRLPVWVITVLAIVVVAFTITRNVGGNATLEWLAATRSS